MNWAEDELILLLLVVTVTAVGRSGGIGAVGVPRGARGGGNHHEVFKNKVDGDLGVRAQTSKTGKFAASYPTMR